MIIPLVGPSCAGKSLLLKNLSLVLPKLRPLESVTTRAKRPTDTVAGEYLFVSDIEFDEMLHRNEFLWVVHPHGLPYRYGTRKSAVIHALMQGTYAPILILEAVEKLFDFAAQQGKSKQVNPVYLHIEDEAELRRRFAERGDASKEDIEIRVKNATYENAHAKRLSAKLHYIDATQTPEQVLSDALTHVRLLEQ